MRRRVFIPAAPGGLEGRVLLSLGAGPHPGAVVLSGPGFNQGTLLVKGDFEQYATGGDLARLRLQLEQNAATIPFGRADGLGPKVNAILAQMQADLAAGVPHAIARAHRAVAAAIKADVVARIQDGSVVVANY